MCEYKKCVVMLLYVFKKCFSFVLSNWLNVKKYVWKTRYTIQHSIGRSKTNVSYTTYTIQSLVNWPIVFRSIVDWLKLIDWRFLILIAMIYSTSFWQILLSYKNSDKSRQYASYFICWCPCSFVIERSRTSIKLNKKLGTYKK